MVAVAPPAASRALLAQNTLRQEKLQRVSNQLRKSKPDGASAPSWKYFECYVLGSLNKYAVCTLCIEQQELERAEIIYSQSPSNRLRHLNTDYPGHRAACDACVEKKNTKKTAARGASGGGSGGQKSDITSYFGVDTSGWHQELVRWMVANAIPLFGEI